VEPECSKSEAQSNPRLRGKSAVWQVFTRKNFLPPPHHVDEGVFVYMVYLSHALGQRIFAPQAIAERKVRTAEYERTP
jgi:hypothetical protein